MSVISRKLLLDAGAQFGHNTRRWNPKMKEYIFEERNGVYIIDLDKTEQMVEKAYEALLSIASEGGKVIFVGTRKQIQDIIREEAIRAGQFYVDQRWLGGTLTNFQTIRKSVNKLFAIEELEESGELDLRTKKEKALTLKEKEKLAKYYTGIKEMKEIPQAMVVVDPKTEEIAVREANKLGIPVFGLVDTNCDPDPVDYVIPANDDAVRCVRLIVATLANAVVVANGGTPIEVVFEEEETATEERPQKPFFNRPRRPQRDILEVKVADGKVTKEFKKPQVSHEKVEVKKALEEKQVKKEEVVKPVKEETAPKVEAKKENTPKEKEAPVKKVVDKKETKATEEKAAVKTVKLEDLGLGNKLTETLKEAGLTTAKKLASKKVSAMKEIKGVGPKAIEEIQKALKTVGLEMKE